MTSAGAYEIREDEEARVDASSAKCAGSSREETWVSGATGTAAATAARGAATLRARAKVLGRVHVERGEWFVG